MCILSPHALLEEGKLLDITRLGVDIPEQALLAPTNKSIAKEGERLASSAPCYLRVLSCFHEMIPRRLTEMFFLCSVWLRVVLPCLRENLAPELNDQGAPSDLQNSAVCPAVSPLESVALLKTSFHWLGSCERSPHWMWFPLQASQTHVPQLGGKTWGAPVAAMRCEAACWQITGYHWAIRKLQRQVLSQSISWVLSQSPLLK